MSKNEFGKYLNTKEKHFSVVDPVKHFSVIILFIKLTLTIGKCWKTRKNLTTN